MNTLYGPNVIVEPFAECGASFVNDSMPALASFTVVFCVSVAYGDTK
jgi:hypothetical protein